MAATAPLASSPARFISAQDAATVLGVGESTVQKWCRTGRLPAVRVGKGYLIPASYFANLEAQALAEAGP